MQSSPFHLLLADDDEDDRMLFREALEELPVACQLYTVKDGVQLMDLLLANETVLPDMLFLDLNMPKKAGVECLTEIRQHEKLKPLPVIIYSTSYNPEVVDQLYESGAHYYIRKPAEFALLKKAIMEAIMIVPKNNLAQPAKEHFVIQV